MPWRHHGRTVDHHLHQANQRWIPPQGSSRCNGCVAMQRDSTAAIWWRMVGWLCLPIADRSLSCKLSFGDAWWGWKCSSQPENPTCGVNHGTSGLLFSWHGSPFSEALIVLEYPCPREQKFMHLLSVLKSSCSSCQNIEDGRMDAMFEQVSKLRNLG